MKNDVSAVQLKQQRKVSFSECALLAVILVVATKFCTLPSVLAGIAGSKAVWAAAILTAIEGATVFFCFQTAKLGGITALPLPDGVKRGICALFAVFFVLKLTVYLRETATYYALSLFENAPVLPVTVILAIACILLARKGFMAVGRMMEIFVWLVVFVFLFVVVFTRTQGDLFNALAMFNPDAKGLGKGVFQGLAWFGDGAVIAFVDLSGQEGSPVGELPAPADRAKAKRRIAFASALFCFATVVVFYAVFTAVYGDAAKMTDYAFIKLSAFKANTDELGSADWPVIILWSILTTLQLTLLFVAGRESLLSATNKKPPEKSSPLPFVLLGVAAVLFSAFFLDEEGDYQRFMTKVTSVFSLVATVWAMGLGVYSLVKGKEALREKQN